MTAESQILTKPRSPAEIRQIRPNILRAYKAPLAGIPSVQAPRAHKTTPYYAKQSQFPEG